MENYEKILWRNGFELSYKVCTGEVWARVDEEGKRQIMFYDSKANILCGEYRLNYENFVDDDGMVEE